MADLDMSDMGKHYMVLAYAPVIDKTEEPAFTQEECQAAAETP